MKRHSNRHLPRLVAEISVTPLLDLMLLLLLTVLVLVPVMQGESQAGSAAPETEARPAPANKIELVVASDLHLMLAGKMIEHRDLIADLKKRTAADPNLGVVVRIPSSLAAPRLLEIMDAMRAASIRHTAVTVSPVLKN